MKKVGFIGLGVMGSAFAERLLKCGYDVVVNDVVQEAVDKMTAMGATSAASPKEIAEQTDVIMTSLPNSAIVNIVFNGPDGLIQSVKEGAVIFDMSTVDADTTRRNAKKFAEKGVTVIDSPVGGGRPNILQGNLPAIMVGGDKEVFEANKEYLECFGKNIAYCGDSGCGNVVKIINNLMSLSNNAIAAEAMVFGTKAGMDPDLLHNVLAHSSCRTLHFVYMYPNLMRRKFEAGFRLDLGKKDIGLALDMAKAMNQPMPMANTIYQLMTAASALGYGNDDCLSVAKVYEEWANIEVKGEGVMPEPGLIG